MFEWLTIDNPVALWWYFLVSVSVINILGFVWTSLYTAQKALSAQDRKMARLLLFLSAFYVFVCAFRSILPRADVQRICLFDTWFSSVIVGRSMATIAELCFVIQWALVLNRVAKQSGANLALIVSKIVVPLIIIAECFSWYAVLTTNYLGNTCEESLWGISYTLLVLALISLLGRTRGAFKLAVLITIVGTVFYVAFMAIVDVPMYLHRWLQDSQNHKPLLTIAQGLQDLNSRWTVSHSIADWRTEIPWMSLYFSVAVWASLALCYVPLDKERLAKYLASTNRDANPQSQ